MFVGLWGFKSALFCQKINLLLAQGTTCFVAQNPLYLTVYIYILYNIYIYTIYIYIYIVIYILYVYIYILLVLHFISVALHMSAFHLTFNVCAFHFAKGHINSCPLDQSPIEQKVEKPEKLLRCTGHSLDDIIARL